MDAQQAGRRIERELLILARHMETASPRRSGRDSGLDRSAHVILSRIEAQGPMSITDLVDAFGLAPSTFTRQMSPLLREGLVERILDPEGTIARKFRITDEGAARLAAHREAVGSGLAHVLTDWPSARLERFVGDLMQFNTDIEAVTGRPWPR